jgi:hypothetical protein
MNTVMPQYNSQQPTRNTLARNRIAVPTARSEPATQPPTTTKATDPTNGGPERSRQPCATYSPSPPSRPWLCSSPHRPTPTPTRTCRTRSPGCSAVAGCLLNELNAQGQAEFGVDVTSSTDPFRTNARTKRRSHMRTRLSAYITIMAVMAIAAATILAPPPRTLNRAAWTTCGTGLATTRPPTNGSYATYNDGQCHGAPAPVAPSPFDPIL